MRQYLERLSQVPLFAECSTKELEQLARILDEVNLPAGRVMATQGEHGREMFIIVSGTAAVVRDSEEIASLGPGDYFGELSLLDAGPRTASVIATEDIDVLVIGRQQFNTVLDDVPGLARRLLTTTARRLREVTSGRLH